MPSIINATTTNGVAISPDNSGSLQLATNNGTTAVTIDTSQNVGIGTSSPTVTLDVNGNVKTGNSVDIGLADSNNTIVNIGTGATGNKFALTDYIGDTTYTDFGLRVGRVNDGANGTSRIQHRGTGGLQIGAFDAGSVQFLTQNTERMRIDASGNVGIGTSSPSSVAGGRCLTLQNSEFATISVKAGVGNANDRNASIELLSSGGGGSFSRILYGDVNASPTTPSPLVFSYYNGSTTTERMRIDSSGKLLVGATSSGTNAYINTVATSTFDGHRVTADSTSLRYIGTWANPNGVVGSISTSGSATTYSTSSDYRLKENIAPMQGALNVVQQLKPVTYNWKVDGSSGQGFIAHELQAVVPDCVTGEKDAVDAEGNPVYQGVDTSFLVATLTAAIQELKAELDTVKAELTTLKNPPVEGTE